MDSALGYLKKELSTFFKKNHIQTNKASVMGTPRRLVVSFNDVDGRQKDVIETHFGPNIKVAYDGDGNPTKSALGFARGKGIDVSQLTVEKNTQGRGDLCSDRKKKANQPRIS